MIWTDEKTAELIRLKADGVSFSRIAVTLGATRGQVGGKAFRMGLCKPSGKPYAERYRDKRSPFAVKSSNWEVKLFEPYAAFKARKAKERADAAL